jgi:hypothetical protein
MINLFLFVFLILLGLSFIAIDLIIMKIIGVLLLFLAWYFYRKGWKGYFTRKTKRPGGS